MQVSRRHFLSSAALTGAGAGVAAQSASAGTVASDARALNLLDFAVAPGSDEDQSPAFQKALDAAAASGRVLQVPPGSYKVSNLTVRSAVQVHGSNGRSALEYSGGGNLMQISEADNVCLVGLTFAGGLKPLDSDDRAGLLQAEGCDNLRIDQCGFVDSATNGVTLTACSGRVADCTFAGAFQAALFSLDASGLEISGNQVRDCLNNGILVWRSEAGEDCTLVTGNRIERIAAFNGGSGQNGNGINIFRAANVVVSQNRITDCAFSAIRSNAGSACQIVGNSCARLGEVAIYAEFGFEGAIIASNMVEKAASGISITNFNEGGRLAICANNIVRDLFTRPGEVDARGVGISAEADTVVEGNVVENAPAHGIALGWGHYLRDVTATGNVVRNCNIGIAVSASQGAGKALVANNMISGAETAAIAGLEHDAVVTADLARPPARIPGNMSVQGNLVS